MRLLKLGRHGEVCLTKDIIGNVLPFVILSNAWGDDNDELTFRDLENGCSKSKASYC